jgi:histidinol dehydrogenase
MAVTAAQVAGVGEIVVVTPPGPGGRVSPSILVAADLCGVDEVYRVGGAQAIAALAYGTESIGRVDLIVGPGGRYVDAAKRLLYGVVAIDLPAGPTELLVVAGEGSDPRRIAWDLISQAEHGEDAVCGLLTPSPRLAGQVGEVVAALMPGLERRELVEAAFRGQGFIGLCRDVEHAVAVADAFAPEHLELLVGEEWAERVSSAGLVLLGPQTPPSLTDYGLGPNHILPTGGAARAFSPLSALTFLRHHFIVRADPKTLAELKGVLEPLARAEGLINHWRALEVRLDE